MHETGPVLPPEGELNTRYATRTHPTSRHQLIALGVFVCHTHI